MRSFVIAHISDLHLSGNHTETSACDVLLAALAGRMDEFRYVPVRILLITGDLVESPGRASFAAAQAFLQKARNMKEFTDVRLVAGNHDVRVSGQGWRKDEIHKEFGDVHKEFGDVHKEVDLVLSTINDCFMPGYGGPPT